MTLDQFEQTVLRLGSDVERWPDDMRAQARALLAAEPAVRERLREWQAHEASLEQALRVDVGASAVTGAVLAGVRDRRQGVRFPSSGRLAALAALSTACGVAAGVLIARLDAVLLNARVIDLALGGGLDLLALL